MTDERFYRWEGGRLILLLKVQPRASRDEFAGEHGGALRVRIQAPPVDGKANAYLIAFLAKRFGVGKKDIDLLSGESARSKRLALRNVSKLPPELGIEEP